MQEIFRSKLSELRKPTDAKSFGEALYGQVFWAKPIPAHKTLTPHQESAKLKENYSEKQQVIESLERFVEDKTKNRKEPTIPVSGGEVILKRPEEIALYYELSSLSDLSKFIPAEAAQEILTLAKNKKKGELTVLFVTENFRPKSERENPENPSLFTKELLPCLPLNTSGLFEKMVSAMKLTPPETLLLGLDYEGEDLLKAVMSVADYLRPAFIVTLGAKSTQKVLNNNDRLTMVHGQFFGRKVGEWNAQIVPLFHPSIIETNQNMKKTAWIDMQKIMKSLKKL